jgi:predicted nucleic acid-binding protein
MLIDTNVLLAATVAAAPRHQAALRLIASLAAGQRPGFICPQVLREFYAAATRPASGAGLRPGFGFAPAEAAAAVVAFRAQFAALPEDDAVTTELLRLVLRYDVTGKQAHDANLVATARRHDVGRIATLDRRDFARFAREIDVVEP